MEQTENLKELVRDEAAKLREFATVEERGRLDFSKLNSNNERLCVYGQMTGKCWSDRAVYLLNKCAIPFSYFTDKFSKSYKWDFGNSVGRDFSPIEFYICQPYAKNAELIAYLKGETDTLEL